MPLETPTSDFVLSGYELANNPTTRITFFDTLNAAIEKQQGLAELGYRAAIVPSTSEDDSVRHSATRVLRTVHRINSSLFQPSDIEQLLHAELTYCNRDSLRGDLFSLISEIEATAAGSAVMRPFLLKAIDHQDDQYRRAAFDHFMRGSVRREEAPDITVPIILRMLSDPLGETRIDGTGYASGILDRHPDRADMIIARLVHLATNDPDDFAKTESASLIKEFGVMHPARTRDLQPNQRLQQLTEQFQKIANS